MGKKCKGRGKHRLSKKATKKSVNESTPENKPTAPSNEIPTIGPQQADIAIEPEDVFPADYSGTNVVDINDKSFQTTPTLQDGTDSGTSPGSDKKDSDNEESNNATDHHDCEMYSTSEESLLLMMPESEMKNATQDIFIDPNKFTPKWIAKIMPTACRFLEGGTLCRVDFLKRFKNELDALADDAESGEVFSSIEDIPADIQAHKHSVVLHESYLIAHKAIPSLFAKISGCSLFKFFEIGYNFAQRVNAFALFLETMSFDRDSDFGEMNWLDRYQMATDMACEKLADEIDKIFFRGKKGTFLRRCKMYNGKGRDMFIEILADKNRAALRRERHYTFSRLEKAVNTVADGRRRHHKTCWQCSKKVAGMSTCSCCNVAQYCCVVCQRKAWKAGHKTACAAIQKKYEVFQESLKVVDAHHQRLLTYSAKDYDVLNYCTNIQVKDPWEGTEHHGALSRPSIYFYFENLRRIRAGEIWFFPSPKVNLQEKTLEQRGYQFSEMTLHTALRYCLCYDYCGYLKQRGLPLSDCESIFAFSKTKFAHADQFRSGMTASRFLELCDRNAVDLNGVDEETAAIRKKRREECSKLFMTEMRDFQP